MSGFNATEGPALLYDSSGNPVLLDAFQRLRISDPVTLFDNVQSYGDSALFWENQATGTGAISNLLNSSAVLMTTGGALSGAKLVRQTRLNYLYQPGKSHLVAMTFVFGVAVANARRRAGYFNAQNGVFLEQTVGAVSLVLRSFVTGSVVDTPVAQADWNLDTFDGSHNARNPSGLLLDLEFNQILTIDLQWLSAGRVRIGFDINGSIFYAHEFLTANLIAAPYMTTASLPVRFEVENTGATADAVTLEQICLTVISEGGVEDRNGFQFAAGNGATSITVTTRRPIMSIRAKTTGPNGARNVSHIIPRMLDVASGGNSSYFELVLNPTTLTGAAFSTFDANNSVAEIDVAASAVAGGIVVGAGYVGQSGGATSRGAEQLGFFKDFALVYTQLLNVQDVLTVVGTSLVAQAATMAASLTWQERN